MAEIFVDEDVLASCKGKIAVIAGNIFLLIQVQIVFS